MPIICFFIHHYNFYFIQCYRKNKAIKCACIIICKIGSSCLEFFRSLWFLDIYIVRHHVLFTLCVIILFTLCVIMFYFHHASCFIYIISHHIFFTLCVIIFYLHYASSCFIYMMRHRVLFTLCVIMFYSHDASSYFASPQIIDANLIRASPII